MNDAKPSKSAKKRTYLELQELGERLVLLSDEQLKGIELDADLRNAVDDARRIRSHGALRRQKQLIGKLMRNIDAEPIRSALDLSGQQGREAKDLFRRAESWRDRIVAEGAAAVADFAADEGCQSAQLKRLSGDLSNTVHAAGQKKLRRQIFKEVHLQLTSVMQNSTC